MTWIKITDITAGSELFNGSAIHAYVSQVTISGGNNVGNKPINGTDVEADSTLDGTDQYALGSSYDRRVGYNSYASFQNPVIKITGNWTEETGSLNSVGSILTPYKLFRMVNTDHQFKLEGGITIPNLVAGETGSGYYMGLAGLPVVFITPWQISENYRNGTNHVNWNASLRLDRIE